MGKIRVTYDVTFKKKAIDIYLHEGMSYETVAKELGIHHSILSRWVKHFEAEGIKGLEV
ncbi:helix-turn-helix domain-containing protein, partial [Bacillus sp. 17RED48]